MATHDKSNIKLGVFVLAGLFALIFSFYMIGKNHNLFGASFELKVRFTNLDGLLEGDNVLFAGIQAGTIKSIQLINDTTIEVSMMIDDKIRNYIYKNAQATIGTEGLMGNKIVNIDPGSGLSSKVEQGDLLSARKSINTDQMLGTLSKTNNNLAVITEAIKGDVLRIDSSAILAMLNNKEIGAGIKLTLKNISVSAFNATEMMANLNQIVAGIKNGKGAAGVLLSDTVVGGNLKRAIVQIKSASDNANYMTAQLNNLVKKMDAEITAGPGTVNLLLNDSLSAKNFRRAMDNIQKGTDNFNQDMEALKQNFLFSGYFKRLAKQQAKQAAKTGQSGGPNQ